MRRRFGAGLCALLATASFAVAQAGAVTTGPVGFESFDDGTVDGQDGWRSLGAAGQGCATYDHAIVTNGGAPSSFGSKSLRISNAVTSGCFGDQTFSKSTADEAGETGAEAGGLSSGPRRPVFDAAWDFASADPTAAQPGLSVVVSPDRGDGARMSWVQMADTAGGLAVSFYDFQQGDFVLTEVASGLDRATAHHVRIVLELRDGPANDVVRLYVDGALEHTGTSWEDYFRDVEGVATRTVDSLLFRTAGAAAPDTAGKGLLVDNVTLSTLGAPDCETSTVGSTVTLLSDCTVSSTYLVAGGTTLDGNGHTITAVDPVGGHFVGAVVGNSGAGDVTIRNLGVTTAGLADACDGGAAALRGILLEGAGGTISGNTVAGINQGASGCQEGNAIDVRNAPLDTTGPDTAVVITDNTVSGYQKTGVLVNGSVKATVTANSVTGLGPVPYIAQNGMQISRGATATLRSNSVSGNAYSGADWTSCGLLLYLADGVKASSTTYDGNQKDLCNYGRGGGNVKPTD